MSESDKQTIEKAAELYAVKYQVGTNRKYEYATKLIMRVLADFQKDDNELNVPRHKRWAPSKFKGFICYSIWYPFLLIYETFY